MEKGYKGPGMCKACIDSRFHHNLRTHYCTKYMSSCKQVARNCPGITSLKPKSYPHYYPPVIAKVHFKDIKQA